MEIEKTLERRGTWAKRLEDGSYEYGCRTGSVTERNERYITLGIAPSREAAFDELERQGFARPIPFKPQLPTSATAALICEHCGEEPIFDDGACRDCFDEINGQFGVGA